MKAATDQPYSYKVASFGYFKMAVGKSKLRNAIVCTTVCTIHHDNDDVTARKMRKKCEETRLQVKSDVK